MRKVPMLFVVTLLVCVFHAVQAAEDRGVVLGKIVKQWDAGPTFGWHDKVGQVRAAKQKDRGEHGEEREHPERDERPERPGRKSRRIVSLGECK